MGVFNTHFLAFSVQKCLTGSRVFAKTTKRAEVGIRSDPPILGQESTVLNTLGVQNCVFNGFVILPKTVKINQKLAGWLSVLAKMALKAPFSPKITTFLAKSLLLLRFNMKSRPLFEQFWWILTSLKFIKIPIKILEESWTYWLFEQKVAIFATFYVQNHLFWRKWWKPTQKWEHSGQENPVRKVLLLEHFSQLDFLATNPLVFGWVLTKMPRIVRK